MIVLKIISLLILMGLCSCANSLGGGGTPVSGAAGGASEVSSSKLAILNNRTVYEQYPSICEPYKDTSLFQNSTLVRDNRRIYIALYLYSDSNCSSLLETQITEFTFSSFTAINDSTDQVMAVWLSNTLIPATGSSVTWNLELRYGYVNWVDGIGKTIAGRSLDGILPNLAKIGDKELFNVSLDNDFITVKEFRFKL